MPSIQDYIRLRQLGAYQKEQADISKAQGDMIEQMGNDLAQMGDSDELQKEEKTKGKMSPEKLKLAVLRMKKKK